MKQYRVPAFFIIRALILLSMPQSSFADQQWHYQAAAQVSQPGLVETVLPAGVFFGTDSAARTSQLDLTRVGPGPSHQLNYDHNDENINQKTSLGSYHTDYRLSTVVW